MTRGADSSRPPATHAGPAAGAKPRLYFDLTDGRTTLRDEVGVEVDDLDHALAEADTVLRNMQGHEEGWSLVIRDEGGAILALRPV